MKLKTKLLLLKIYTYIVGGLLTTIAIAFQVAVLAGILWLIMNLCSCSSSRPVVTETAATESTSALETTRDSIGSDKELQTSTSGYLEISDLSILFYPPSDIQPAAVPEDTMARDPLELNMPQRPKILYPALLNIGLLSAGNASNTALKESNDSVGSKTAEFSHDQSTKDSEQRIRDPTPCRWPVFLVLGCALVMIIFTGWKLYRTEA